MDVQNPNTHTNVVSTGATSLFEATKFAGGVWCLVDSRRSVKADFRQFGV